MAQELRKIAFNLIELQAVLENFAHKTGKKMPGAALKAVKQEPSGRIVFAFGDDQAGSVAFQPKDMTAALLVFCQDRQIPVPKGGKKVLNVEGNILNMLIKLA